MRNSTGRGSPWLETPAEASTPASTIASAWAPAGSQPATDFSTAPATVSAPERGPAAALPASPSSSKVSISGAGATGTGARATPDGEAPGPRKYGSAPSASPGAADGGRTACSRRLQLVDRRLLPVDHAARVLGIADEAPAQPLVLGPEPPRLALHLAQPGLDRPEPRLGAPGPDLLRHIRPGELGLDAAGGAGSLAPARRSARPRARAAPPRL